MTMIDEGKLIDALGAAASGFEVSKDATDKILSVAAGASGAQA